jgi:hypothetical protein
MTLLRSGTLIVFINSRPKTVYEFVLNLEYLPNGIRWLVVQLFFLKREWIAEIPPTRAGQV